MKTLKYIYVISLLILLSAYSLFADGLIIIPRPQPLQSPYPLEVVYHHVDVKINGNVAETFIDQEFYNPSNIMLEGYYIFPIPKGCSDKRFQYGNKW